MPEIEAKEDEEDEETVAVEVVVEEDTPVFSDCGVDSTPRPSTPHALLPPSLSPGACTTAATAATAVTDETDDPGGGDARSCSPAVRGNEAEGGGKGSAGSRCGWADSAAQNCAAHAE